MNDNNLYNSYKPLKNHLRQTFVIESLYVIWAYSAYLQFKNPIPRNIEFLQSAITSLTMITGWELELLARETIINAEESGYFKKTLKKWSYFAGAINKLKDTENEISKLYIDEKNVLLELYRLAHRQFPWQTQTSRQYITRYFKIFSYPTIDEIIQRKIGFSSVQKLYFLGMLFWGFFMKKAFLKFPLSIVGMQEINTQDLELFLNFSSKNLNDLKYLLKNDQEINEKFAYTYSSLKAYPIIKLSDYAICPSPNLLMWRITNGIYYDICNEKDFGNEFGKAFQKYVGDVAKTGGDKINVYEEREYYDKKIKTLKNTVDWIIEDKTAALFIECKTKRLTILAKSELKSQADLSRCLNTLSDAVIQVYKTAIDYSENRYPQFGFKQERKIYPLIVTLEDWYIFGDQLRSALNDMVLEKLQLQNISLSLLSEMPYSVCSVQEFEAITQIISRLGIDNFMSKKLSNKEWRVWDFNEYCKSAFPEEYRETKFLFAADFNKIFSERTIEELNLRKGMDNNEILD